MLRKTPARAYSCLGLWSAMPRVIVAMMSTRGRMRTVAVGGGACKQIAGRKKTTT
jgi:hypothetical protein